MPLGLHLSLLGGPLPDRLVGPRDAQPTRADQEGGAQHPRPPRADSQRVPGQEGILQRHRGGPELQDQTDHQKSVRLPDPESSGNRPLPRSGTTTRANTRPRILLRRRKTKNCRRHSRGKNGRLIRFVGVAWCPQCRSHTHQSEAFARVLVRLSHFLGRPG